MNNKDEIKELFAQKLKNHEVTVKPELWNAIASKVTTNVVVNTGMSIGLKTIIISASVVSLTTLVLISTFINTNETKSKSAQTQQEVSSSNQLKETNKSELIENNTIVLDKKITEKITEKKINSEFNSTINENVNSKIDNENANFIIKTNPLESENPSINKKSTSSIENKPNSNSNALNEESKTLIEQKSTPSFNEESEFVVNLPNVFTPNGDGENDFFELKMNTIYDFSITILNDKNQVVFTSSDQNFKWNGNDLSNNIVAKGNYIYYFSGKDANNKSIAKFSQLLIKY